MSSCQERFTELYSKGGWSGKDWSTRSGPGSSVQTTVELRHFLPYIVRGLGGKSLADLPCGEWGYFAHIRLDGIQYCGYDVVQAIIDTNRHRYPNRRFICLDVTQCSPAFADVVFVKDLLQHLTNAEVGRVISNVASSGARWLLASSDTYPLPASNDSRPNRGNISAPVNLSVKPFSLRVPVLTIRLDRKYYSVYALNTIDNIDTTIERLASSLEMGVMDGDEGSLLPMLAHRLLLPSYRVIGRSTGARLLPQEGGFWDVHGGLGVSRDLEETLLKEAGPTPALAFAHSYAEYLRRHEAPYEDSEWNADGEALTILLSTMGLVTLSPHLAPSETEHALRKIAGRASAGKYVNSVVRVLVEATKEFGWCSLERWARDRRMINCAARHFRLSTGSRFSEDTELAALDLASMPQTRR